MAVALLALATLWSFHHQIFEDWTFQWDYLATYTASPAFVAATVGHLRLAGWDPFVASGFPVAVSPQSELYFPVWWLLGILRIPATLSVLTDVQVLHVFFGACGVLVLGRARKLEWRWAFVAALAYVFFGGFYGDAEHADIFRGYAYLPWLLWSLTPPTETRSRWTRLIALPFVVWLIASGAYPADLVSYAIIGIFYLFFALRQGHAWQRELLIPLALAVAASAMACIAVLLPYFLATHANELYRPSLPTATDRAAWSITPDDFFGLYLNPFAWRTDGTITSWAIGIPSLVGLALLTKRVLRRQSPLLIIAAVGLALAMTPKIGFIGRLMAGPLTSLFPSRFPAADYKAAVAVAFVILAADAWRGVAEREVGFRRVVLSATIAGVGLIVAAILAPSSHASPTRTLWLVILVAVACIALAAARPKHALVFVTALAVLVAIDGWRDARDNLLDGTTSPWLVPASVKPVGNRDTYVDNLNKALAARPASRPARVAPALGLADGADGGINADSLGWVADGYHLDDYGGTIERSLEGVETHPTWAKLFLEPWHAWVFPCAKVSCVAGSVRLPSAQTWTPSSQVRSLSYSDAGVTYSVHVTRPSLMVENELPLKGWGSNSTRVKLVSAGVPFRAWRLAPGNYEFTATYSQPGAAAQGVVAIIGVLLLVGLGATLWWQRRHQLLMPEQHAGTDT